MEYGSSLSGMNISIDLTPETEDEVVEIRKTKKVRQPFPPYTMVGNGKTSKRGESMDLIDVCSQLNTAENNLLKFFRDCILENNVLREDNPNVVKPRSYEKFSDYLRVAIKKNYKHLKEMGVLIRVHRGKYMVNPALFIPSKDFVRIKGVWDELVAKDEYVTNSTNS